LIRCVLDCHQIEPFVLSVLILARANVAIRACVYHLHLWPRLRMRRAVPPLPHTFSWRLAYLSARTFYLYLYLVVQVAFGMASQAVISPLTWCLVKQGVCSSWSQAWLSTETNLPILFPVPYRQ